MSGEQCAGLAAAVLDLEIEETEVDLRIAEANGRDDYAAELRADLEALRLRRLALLSPGAGEALCSEM